MSNVLLAVDNGLSNLADFAIVGAVVVTISGAFVAGIVTVFKVLWNYIEGQEARHAIEKAIIRKEHLEELDRLHFLQSKRQGC